MRSVKVPSVENGIVNLSFPLYLDTKETTLEGTLPFWGPGKQNRNICCNEVEWLIKKYK